MAVINGICMIKFKYWHKCRLYVPKVLITIFYNRFHKWCTVVINLKVLALLWTLVMHIGMFYKKRSNFTTLKLVIYYFTLQLKRIVLL